MAKKRRRRKLWSYTAGKRGNRVRVYEREPDGVLWSSAWDPVSVKEVRRSLRHRDKERAETWADEQALKLKQGLDDLRTGRPTASRVFARYQERRTPQKRTKQSRTDDDRRVKMFTRCFGADKDLEQITLEEWDRFKCERMSGVIDPRGNRPKPGKGKPVRARSVEADLKWLRGVLSWATSEQVDGQRFLMDRNPVRGDAFKVPTEKNKLQPVASTDRFERVRRKADRVQMEIRWRGKREKRPSYLPELLDIVHGTGRRISAVLRLRYADLMLDQGRNGSIRWRASGDKQGKEWLVPMNSQVRTAIDRILHDRPGVGDAYVFPSPDDPNKPVRYERATVWLEKAEKLAKVPKLEGGVWHPYRRLWATERKHLPVQDVAAAGGWSSVEVVQEIYQKADPRTMLKVVEGGRGLKEAM